MQPSEFHVAILGGGIGGLTTALSLAHHCPGIQISLFEQAPAYTEIGAGIGLGVNAGRILDRLGVYDAANRISGERNGIHRSHRRWDNGGEIVTIDHGGLDKGGVRQLSVHRAEFLEVLLQAIKERGIATLYANKRGVKVAEAKNNKVTLSFADSTSTTVDLIVAADGIHSSIRAQFVPDHPRYSGRIAYRGLLPLSAVTTESPVPWPFPSYAISWLAPGKHFLVFPISQNRTLNVVAFVSKPDPPADLRESWTSTAPRAELEAEYADWDPTVRRILSHMTDPVGKWRLNDRELLGQWTFLNGKVVLLGDGAHAMLPHQGSGAGHAIEDAYILGRSVQAFFKHGKSAADLAVWTKVYQGVRLPRTQKAQITSRQAGDVYEMEGPSFEGLSYEECLPIVKEKLSGRMKWVWGGDVDREYEAVASLVKKPPAAAEVVTVNGAGGRGVERVELREEILT